MTTTSMTVIQHIYDLFFSQWNLSGGCMNPARNFGPMVINAAYDKVWASSFTQLLYITLYRGMIFNYNYFETNYSGLSSFQCFVGRSSMDSLVNIHM